MATINIASVVESKNPKFVFCLNALGINSSLPTTALSGRHIYNMGHPPSLANSNSNASSRTLSHASALNTTNHTITVPNTGYYEVSFQFSAKISGVLTEVAMCKNWIQQNNTTSTCPAASRVLYINCPRDTSVTGRVSYSRSAICFLSAGDTLQLVEIGIGSTDCENFSISIKEL
jgi:hypothetical protein